MTIQRIETIGDCTLYLADCRDVLPALGNIHAVVTDPPYVIEASGGGIGARRAYFKDIHGHIDQGFDKEILLNFRNWLVFCGKKQIIELAQAAERQGLRWQLLTWNKNNPTPLSNGNYLPDTEYMIHAFVRHEYESKSRWIAGNVEKNEFAHPTVKPLYVMQRAVKNASISGQTILDPFMGSGTTGVACVKMGRKFIGIEIDPEYFEIACRRIREAYAQPDMFVAQPVAQHQHSLLGGV